MTSYSTRIRWQTAFEQVLASGLNRRAVIVLLKDATGQKLSSIEAVLDGIETIRDRYCQPKS